MSVFIFRECALNLSFSIPWHETPSFAACWNTEKWPKPNLLVTLFSNRISSSRKPGIPAKHFTPILPKWVINHVAGVSKRWGCGIFWCNLYDDLIASSDKKKKGKSVLCTDYILPCGAASAQFDPQVLFFFFLPPGGWRNDSHQSPRVSASWLAYLSSFTLSVAIITQPNDTGAPMCPPLIILFSSAIKLLMS